MMDINELKYFSCLPPNNWLRWFNYDLKLHSKGFTYYLWLRMKDIRGTFTFEVKNYKVRKAILNDIKYSVDEIFDEISEPAKREIQDQISLINEIKRFCPTIKFLFSKRDPLLIPLEQLKQNFSSLEKEKQKMVLESLEEVLNENNDSQGIDQLFKIWIDQGKITKIKYKDSFGWNETTLEYALELDVLKEYLHVIKIFDLALREVPERIALFTKIYNNETYPPHPSEITEESKSYDAKYDIKKDTISQRHQKLLLKHLDDFQYAINHKMATAVMVSAVSIIETLLLDKLFEIADNKLKQHVLNTNDVYKFELGELINSTFAAQIR